jgi:mannose/fructose/N-acetylgalactosamine-specific phosphotransferase system component IIC
MTASGRPTEVSVTFWHLGGMVAFFMKPFLLCLALIPAGLVAVLWFKTLPVAFGQAMELFVTFLPLLGVAAVARRLSMNTLDRTLLLGFCIGAVCVLVFHLPEFAAIMIAAAGGWLGVRSHGS